MLAKCVNPACSPTFHYFYEGKLFTIESSADSQRMGPPSDPEYSGRSHTIQYFWLCPSCCCSMTVERDGDQGVSLVAKQGMPPNVFAIKDRTPIVA
jgi:hypothetical protein